MKLLPYLRTSTDDKGQDPQRQTVAIERWAHENRVELLPAVVDEGTSGTKTSPLDRPKFVLAIHNATELGGAGIVVEDESRLTRRGSEEFFVVRRALLVEHGLAIFTTGLALEEQRAAVGELLTSVKAMVARMESEMHGKRVRSGMARAQDLGRRVGRPRKEITAEELELARSLRAHGQGWGRIALALSRKRGAHDVADPKAAQTRRVTASTLRRAFQKRPNFGKGVDDRA